MLCNIILPLAIEGVLTYNIPDHLCPTGSTIIGRRVLVPLGKKKMLSGIIFSIADENVDSTINIKDVICFIDEQPIVTAAQIKLWQWIAQYYMCSLGEVMKAALPSALRLESETHILFNADYEAVNRLSKNEEIILNSLSDGKEKTLDEISQLVGLKNVVPIVTKLLAKNAILTGEELKNGYNPKYKTIVRLAEPYAENEDSLQQVLNSLNKAPKQLNLLSTFLNTGLQEIEKDELMKLSGESTGIFKSLINRGVFNQIKYQTTRFQHDQMQTLPPLPLSEEQACVAENINEKWNEHNVVLLHGVTGSGKTEVYIHLILQQLALGKRVLYLVPEIALTTQLTERLRKVFGSQLGVYHSRFSDQQRAETFLNLLSPNSYNIILGVRSAIFLPIDNLGLIIIDEEHDQSYKQQDPAPRYHARNTAIVLAKLVGAKILLGTATPSIETYYNAQSGKYALVELKNRYRNISLPQISLIDIKEQYRKKQIQGHFADATIDKINDEYNKNKQIIVFQNRRGYAPWMECKQCAYIPKCVNCHVSMTIHKAKGVLCCHYCGYTIKIPSKCPSCHNDSLTIHGIGTERVEDELKQIVSGANICRMDLDTTRSKNSYQKIIDDFAQHKVDILVGTQMVSKGLHFDNVSTVVVLNADNLLNQPDFRSSEKAFQMLEQVSGRAGRTEKIGQVLIQTSNPDNKVLQQVIHHDYFAMYNEQIKERNNFKYPPFYRLISLQIRHRDSHTIDFVTELIQNNLQKVFTHRCSKVITPVIDRIKNQYIRQIIIKIELNAPYQTAKDLLMGVIYNCRKQSDVKAAKIIIDVDPL